MKFLFIASIQTARRLIRKDNRPGCLLMHALPPPVASPLPIIQPVCAKHVRTSPKKLAFLLAFRIASEEDVPAINAGIITFSKAVNSGSNWWNWNTKPICRLRKADNSFSFKQLTSVPFSKIVPVSALSSVPIICNNVVFPHRWAPQYLPLLLFLSSSQYLSVPAMSRNSSLFPVILS